MAVPGVDYAFSGFQWPNPAQITFSIAPDGVFWSHGTNDLNAALDAKLGPGVWERDIAKALATWESVANLNIAQVADGPFDFDTLGRAQGDPRFGDIRFGGYAFPGDTTTLAETYFPPPQGSTAAGDVVVNTGMNFNTGSAYDFYSVLLHETGHSLGLDHPSNPAEVMYPTYQGVRAGLAPGDVAGIQALYGPRVPDAFQQHGQGTSLASAVDVTPTLNAWGRASLGGVSLSTAGDTEYFSVVAPPGATGPLGVVAVAGGVSLLSPQVSLFDASGHLLSSAANPSAWGDSVVTGTPSVVPGQRYYVAVTGATGDVFSVGSYVLGVAFGGVKPVAAPTPVVTTPPPPGPVGTPVSVAPAPTVVVPPDRFEPNNTPATATPLGTVSVTAVTGLTLNTPGDVDDFVFRNARAGVLVVAARGPQVNTYVQVVDTAGNVLAQGVDQVVVRLARPRTPLYVELTAAAGSPLGGYSLAIASVGGSASSGLRARGQTSPSRETVVAVAPPAAPASKPASARPWTWARTAAGAGRLAARRI